MSYFSYVLHPELASVNDYVLYHNTNPYKAYNILKNNLFRLSLSETNSSEHNTGKPVKLYYMSLARTPSSGYIADRSNGLRRVNETVLFVLDKKKLQRKRGIVLKPVNYWNFKGSENKTGRHFGSARETEERLFSNELEITNIISLIKELRIYFYDYDFQSQSSLQYTRKLYYLAKLHRIPVKFFSSNNFQGYLHGKEQKQDRDTVLKAIKITFPNTHSYRTRISEMFNTKIVKKKWPSAYRTSTGMLNTLEYYINANSLDELPSKIRYSLYYLVQSPTEFKKHYSADIHNLRAGPYQDKIEFDKLIKQTKSKSVHEFFDYLYKKWTKIYKEYNKSN